MSFASDRGAARRQAATALADLFEASGVPYSCMAAVRRVIAGPAAKLASPLLSARNAEDAGVREVHKRYLARRENNA